MCELIVLQELFSRVHVVAWGVADFLCVRRFFHTGFKDLQVSGNMRSSEDSQKPQGCPFIAVMVLGTGRK